MERIPVTIITGFLGVGKTTLLNHLIQSNPEKRIAIIENEFGETPIDNELVVSTDNDIFELSNGCICCSLNDDLTPVLIKLLNNKGRKVDHLIVETTGIADPGLVANSFLSDPKIRSIFYIDSIITIVDGQFIEQQLENFDEACKQVALADVVLINKSDKIEEYAKDTISNIIKGINPQALLFKCEFGKVEDSDLLNINSFDAANILKTTLKKSFAPSSVSKLTLNFKKLNSADTSSALINDKIKHLKHQDITSESFVFPEAIDPLIFSVWIQMTLNLKNMEIYRAKGILQFKNN